MQTFNHDVYTKKIRKRLKVYVGVLFVMFIYMVAVGQLGYGDSRKMTLFADSTSKIIFFGGLLFIIVKIVKIKIALNNEQKLIERYQIENDERRQYIYKRSGGKSSNILIIFLLFITCTTALMNLTIFHIFFKILFVVAVIKFLVYLYYRKVKPL